MNRSLYIAVTSGSNSKWLQFILKSKTNRYSRRCHPVMHLGVQQLDVNRNSGDVRNPWVTSPRILFWEERIRSPQDRKPRRELYLGETEFAPPRTEFGVTSPRIPVHVQLLHPKCITGWHRRLYQYFLELVLHIFGD